MLYRYVWPQREWFFNRFVHKGGIDFRHFLHKQGMFFCICLLEEAIFSLLSRRPSAKPLIHIAFWFELGSYV